MIEDDEEIQDFRRKFEEIEDDLEVRCFFGDVCIMMTMTMMRSNDDDDDDDEEEEEVDELSMKMTSKKNRFEVSIFYDGKLTNNMAKSRSVLTVSTNITAFFLLLNNKFAGDLSWLLWASTKLRRNKQFF